MTVKARVQKHRAKLKTKQCGRLEVCIGLDVIEGVRELAKRKKISTWEVVEDALKAALLNATLFFGATWLKFGQSGLWYRW